MENNIINFKIIQIATEQFAILPESFKEGEQASIEHELGFGIDKENKRILVRKVARFLHPTASPFMIISIACHFEIDDESWKQLDAKDSEKIILPNDFAVHLAMLVVGTLRGTLHAKTENTPFNQFIFPPFNVLSLMPEVISFD